MTISAAPILSFKLDNRIGGSPRYVLTSNEDEMRQVAPEILKCVFFLASKQKGEMRFHGTGFQVNHPMENRPGNEMLYLLTARHVIEDIRNRSDDAKVYLRVNLKGGSAAFAETKEADWHFHDDPRVDVAFAQVWHDGQWDHLAVQTKAFVTDGVISTHSIGPGSELFFPGLFVKHAGQGRNLPIIRTGTMASLPHERIQTKFGPMEAYLVEVRSIGGLSGSPVFVATEAFTTAQGKSRVYESFLLGMIHGHYGTRDIPDSAIDDSLFPIQESRSVNMGIGIVVPAKDIAQGLKMPRFVEARRIVGEHMNLKDKQNLPEPD